MRAIQASIEWYAWCIKNAGFVNRLLEKRGGWKERDQFIYDGCKRPCIVNPSNVQFFKHGGAPLLVKEAVWLLGIDDVVNLLEEMLPRLGEGDYGWALRSEPETGMYEAWIPGYHEETGNKETYRTGFFPTPLVALMELLFIMVEIAE